MARAWTLTGKALGVIAAVLAWPSLDAGVEYVLGEYLTSAYGSLSSFLCFLLVCAATVCVFALTQIAVVFGGAWVQMTFAARRMQ